MQLSLRRWDGPTGDSRGHWLVRELPGIAIIKLPQGWRIKEIYLMEPNPFWEKQAEISEAQLKEMGLRTPEGRTQFFETRTEALMRLEELLNLTPSRAIAHAFEG